MALVNVDQATKEFHVRRVDDGFYRKDRSHNTEVDYMRNKEERDTEAVKEFTSTKTFGFIEQLI